MRRLEVRTSINAGGETVAAVATGGCATGERCDSLFALHGGWSVPLCTIQRALCTEQSICLRGKQVEHTHLVDNGLEVRVLVQQDLSDEVPARVGIGWI